MSNTEIPMECKLPIFNRFQEKKYINTKTQEVETKIITHDLMLIKLLKDFSYIDDGFYDLPSLEVYYKGLDLCDWEEAITALYMFSPEYIENDSYYDGKYDTIINVYKRPASERKAIYDLFQYLDDSETKSQSEKIIFDYEKFEKEYVEIKDEENDKEFQHYVEVLLSPLIKNVQKESFDLSESWTELERNLVNGNVNDVLEKCKSLEKKYYLVYEQAEAICSRVTDITLEYKGEDSSGEIPVGGDIGEYLKYYQQLDDEED